MIPETQLELKNIDPETLGFDEITLLVAPEELTPKEQIVALRAFILEHSNWTRKELGRVTVGELKQVMADLGNKFKDLAVPKVNATPSEPGPDSTPLTAPAGETS